ncbi:hypothetical protein L228DRAFT_244132 [Xylona heveae TC161]|uniref:NADH-ubiquinone oxidoreductase 299 kDa subunit n=1 Tax=Xylona heveae (strain CBS 132557 / TC161) TaxID=1328760 RepID=A0A165ISH2_XYLHT|nr:hypothetical protein L228DRAFT_244132 [Xylona heveae TC161]KZF25321.1 hypothetical protein L228DRAFT_244132 [Xylona heveae TC161]
MRATTRLLATLKPARYLEPNSPTGLTGLFTHPTPRSTLLYLYSATLDKLQSMPESCVYRQSTEALTKHRLQIVESVKPPGYETWLAKINKEMETHPEVFKSSGPQAGRSQKISHHGRTFVATELREPPDEREEEWDGEHVGPPELEGTRTSAERAGQKNLAHDEYEASKTVEWDPEPLLEASQIAELENQIGAGLIEEVIEVAEGELKLADVIAQNRVWEDLEEKPAEGQWTYFERGTHMPQTQSP